MPHGCHLSVTNGVHTRTRFFLQPLLFRSPQEHSVSSGEPTYDKRGIEWGLLQNVQSSPYDQRIHFPFRHLPAIPLRKRNTHASFKFPVINTAQFSESSSIEKFYYKLWRYICSIFQVFDHMRELRI